ncbi:MAG: 50S ribosomal protein L23 [Candidatus Moranbacteria bacterium CG10_big_fil_rev_8_21_14_0_10_35_21]|nr:MAG: 50S ribosomal protein L23 [Candidatus Moranbacteria bacterium CG10_big_fil_rev_8_21_14_0_10_35_21]PJA88770.1 MAG: 50S ribosomal protein L23 [Candidatus Moranbacteria bacterium CG_4_9_14_3_um_filter_36_9]
MEKAIAKKENKEKQIIGNVDFGILVEPWVTEASTAMMEMNKYVFKVASRAEKGKIKRAVEGLYNVKVIAVNTINIPKKLRNYGNTPGWKSGFKKAIITLKEGDKIELFEGASK